MLQTADDGSGRPRWAIVPVAGRAGQFYLINRGRPGTCGAFAGVPACATNNFQLTFGTGDNGTHYADRVRWMSEV